MRTVDIGKAVEAFGGYSNLARMLGVPLTTCHGWARRKKIPDWRVDQIIALAKQERKDVYKRRRGARGKHRKRREN